MDVKEYPYTLYLKPNTEEKLLFQFNKMNSVSREILEKLLNEKKYEIQSNVSKDVFRIFAQYLNDGNIPEINGNNFYELKILAYEFQLNDLISTIKAKATKWTECEKYLEQQEQINCDLQKNIKYLSDLIQELLNKCNHLENQQINFQSQIDEQNAKIIQLHDELISQNLLNQSNHSQEIEDKFQEMSLKIDDYNNSLDSKINEQINKNQENSNKIENINSFIESLRDQISSAQEKCNELENLFNEKATLQSSRIDSLKVDIDTKLQSYITRYQLRNIFTKGQKSYLLDSYTDYSKWYFTPEGKAAQIDGNYGHALVAWGWKKALELI